MQVVVGNHGVPLIYSGRLIGVGAYLSPYVTEKTWDGLDDIPPAYLSARQIWYGPDVEPPTKVYMSFGERVQKVLDVENSAWVDKTWNVVGDNTIPNLYGTSIWRFKNHVYLDYGSAHKSLVGGDDGTWYRMNDDGMTGGIPLSGGYVWTHGEYAYNSRGAEQYSLHSPSGNISGKPWEMHQWGIDGYPGHAASFYADSVWQDGDNVYVSAGEYQYILNISESTLYVKQWNGLTSFYGGDVWSNGTYTFYSDNKRHYVLDSASSTWYRIDFGINFYGRHVWTDLHGHWYVNFTHELHFN